MAYRSRGAGYIVLRFRADNLGIWRLPTGRPDKQAKWASFSIIVMIRIELNQRAVGRPRRYSSIFVKEIDPFKKKKKTALEQKEQFLAIIGTEL
jgi:hypothetical protein